MSRMPTDKRTQIQGLYLDMIEYDGSGTIHDGNNPRLSTRGIIASKQGTDVEVSESGELITASKVDDISVNFQYGIRTADVETTVSGTGAFGATGSLAYVETGTGVGSAMIQSKDSVRYKAGHQCYFDPSVLIPAPEDGVNIYVGALNNVDGICWGYQGLTLGLWFIEGGNFNFIPRTEWTDKLDGKGESGYEINPNAAQIPKLRYTWHGIKDISYGFDLGNGNVIEVYRQTFINTQTAIETHLENPNLPMAIKVERTSGTGSNIRVYTGSWRAGSYAGQDENNLSNYWVNVTALDRPLTSSVNNNIVAIRNKSTYNGKVNHIKVELGVVTFANDGNKTVAVYGNKGASVTGLGAFTDVNTVNSTLEYAVGGTLTGGTRGAATILKASQDRRSDVIGTGIFIYPGETLYIEVVPGGAIAGTFSVSLRFVEYH